MNQRSVKAIALVAALALPAAGLAQDAKPGEFKIPGTDTTIKLNGFVELDAIYDFDGAIENIRGSDWASFLPDQPFDDGERDENRLYMTARTSRVGLTTTTPVGANSLVVRVEGDFNSPSAFNYSTEATTNGTNFRIRHAYGEYAGLLIGQTWSTFTDLGSLPDTVDFNPHGGFALARSPMIRYALPVGGGSLALALENPQSITLGAASFVGDPADNSVTVGRERDRFPDAIASLTIPFSFGHVNARAVALEYQGRNAAGVSDSKWGWGAGLSGSLKLGGADTVVWSVQGGDGIGRYTFQTLLQGGWLVGDEVQTWKNVAYHVGLTHKWSDALRSNVIWSQTFVESDDELEALIPTLANERIDALFVNTFMSPMKSTEFGVEYAWGKREVFDGREGTQHRVNALVRYNFF